MTAVAGTAGFTGSAITQWCATCEDYAVPMTNGTCGFCGGRLDSAPPSVVGPATELGDRPAPPPRLPLQSRTQALPTERQIERRLPLEHGQVGFGPVCGCGAPKSKQAHTCAKCWKAADRAGGRGTPRPAMRGPYGVSEDLMVEIRRMYEDEQISLREIARRIYDQTYGYLNPRSLGEALYRGFRNRGWPTRSQSDATRLRNWKHGLKTRAQTNEEQVAYRHWLAQQRGWDAVQGPGRPTCKGVRACSPRKGQPCQREAMAGSDYCYSHDPAKAAERNAHLARARAKVAPEEQQRILSDARARKAARRAATTS